MNDPDAAGNTVVLRVLSCRFWPATLEHMMEWADEDDELPPDLRANLEEIQRLLIKSYLINLDRDSNCCRLCDEEGNIIIPPDEEPDLPAPEERR